ncbi:MAG TPA: hypothetical protein VN622_08385 [Clostridia bacterium]|nr:hypothetical protein [Clostridia bacterium]
MALDLNSIGTLGRSKPKFQFPSDRVGFTRQLFLLRTYARLGRENKDVTNEQVAEAAGMAATTVSTCNPFFVAANLLTKGLGTGYKPTFDVTAYSLAHDCRDARAAEKLAPALKKTWFSQALLPRLRECPLALQESIATLVNAAGGNSSHASQVSIIVDFLLAAGLIVREGELLRAYSEFSFLSIFAGKDVTEDQSSTTHARAVPFHATESLQRSERISIPLGKGRTAYLELPGDWDEARDLKRLLAILELSLQEDQPSSPSQQARQTERKEVG